MVMTLGLSRPRIHLQHRLPSSQSGAVANNNHPRGKNPRCFSANEDQISLCVCPRKLDVNIVWGNGPKEHSAGEEVVPTHFFQ